MKVYNLLVLILLLGFAGYSQKSDSLYFDGFVDTPRGASGIRTMFYNCENYFDPMHDSLKNDMDFTPNGNYNYDENKYFAKQKNLAKVISAVGGWEAPEVVGLCEIENLSVLLGLTLNTNLKKHGYGIVHFESPDRRGIDVALLYRREKIEILTKKAIGLVFPGDTSSKTRDILYVKALVLQTDTLHIFVNHWPSRYGGRTETDPKRMMAATTLRKATDSIMAVDSCSNILIMGDLNDGPTEASLMEGLKSVAPGFNSNQQLVNLMIPLERKGMGSHYYGAEIGNKWNPLDQLILSGSLIKGCNKMVADSAGAKIFKAGFLLENSGEGDFVPKRTYVGMKYNGGFSDHLPVYIDIYFKKK